MRWRWPNAARLRSCKCAAELASGGAVDPVRLMVCVQYAIDLHLKEFAKPPHFGHDAEQDGVGAIIDLPPIKPVATQVGRAHIP